MLHRRTFLTGLVSVIAAPAIVRASSLMPVRLVTWADDGMLFSERYAWAKVVPPNLWRDLVLYGTVTVKQEFGELGEYRGMRIIEAKEIPSA
jgi:hypothetical protein